MLETILLRGVEQGASNLFIVAGLPITFKINGVLLREETPLTADESSLLVQDAYALSNQRSMDSYFEMGDDDFSCEMGRASGGDRV